MKYNILPLNSVGCGIDKNTGITYPMYKDGTYDKNSGVHFQDIDEDWFHKLSPEDNIIVNDVMYEY